MDGGVLLQCHFFGGGPATSRSSASSRPSGEGEADATGVAPPAHSCRRGAGKTRSKRVAGQSSLTADQRLPCGLFHSQVNELLDRDITPDDYELLLLLDDSVAKPVASKEDIESLPTRCAGEFLTESCSVCLVSFEPEDSVTTLPCQHTFHRECIERWLTQRNRRCPLCTADAFPFCSI